MASARSEPVKVVIIDTKYVEADPMSFKSVVQSLTGKDSCVAWIEESSLVGQKRSRQRTIPGGHKRSRGNGDGGEGVLTLTEDTSSFNEFDRLLLELPPVDELHWLWAD